MSQSDLDVVSLRRSFHQYPEPAWAEFYTTYLIARQTRAIDGVRTLIGKNAVNPESRMGVPESDVLSSWYSNALDSGADERILSELKNGLTGAVAVLEKGDGPVIGVRVDIDGLRIEESSSDSHEPSVEGFDSKHEGMMHACGHDANAAIGIDILHQAAHSSFEGTLKVFFQPASEVEGGGAAMADTPNVSDIDHFILLKVGMGYDTGEVVADANDIYGIQRLRSEFSGENAHAGFSPNEGHNAIHAMATATQNLLGIPRHEDGDTRINVGTISGGEAPNLIPKHGEIEIDIRGKNQTLISYMRQKTDTMVEHSAKAHDCMGTTEVEGSAPSSSSNRSLGAQIEQAALGMDSISQVHRNQSLGTGDDGAHLMEAVKNAGGNATYTIVGADLASGHHTNTFDIDEQSLDIATGLVINYLATLD